MKKLIYILLLLPSLVIAQTTTENYVVKKVFNTKRTTVSGLNTIPADSITKIVSYFDGLGRAKQNVAVKAGGNKEDIVTHFEYDALGRQIKDYLPYAIISNDGLFRTGNQASATNQYYFNNYATDFAGVTLPENANAYSEKNIENSPLNRVLEQAAPGKDWKLGGNFLPKGYTDGHTIKFEYDTNSSNDAVKSYSVTTIYTNNTYTPALIYNGVYTVNVLTKTITEDENWNSTQTYLKDHTTEEFKNKLGQVVLKRTYNNNITHDTYYVYDNFGNLTYVLPPKVITSDGISSTELSELSYQYKYDHRNRLVEKKIPGKGEEYIVYDNLDRPVLTQDANQRVPSTNEWLFTKYDALGRVVYTGVYDSNSTRLSLQSTFDSKAATSNYETKLTTSGTLGIYYSNSDFPSSNLEVLTVNYYDNYTFDRTTGIGTTAISYGLTSTTNTKGLATGTKVKVLNTSNWITTVNYYDDKARPIYIFSKNDFLQTTDIVKTKLDFVGKAKTVTTQHTKSNGNHSTQSIEDVLTYDHAGRLKIQDQSLNGSGIWERVVSNTYDELGQLTSKGVGNNKNSSRLQTVNYNYNVRGWLKNINQDAIADNDLFNFTLKYNDPTSGTALYNGNISQTNWNTLNTDSSTKTYTYSYDALNRITSGIDNTGNYNLNSVTYDKNGNIDRLIRKGHTNSGASSFGTMDDLYYYYNGNQLHSVTDNGNDTFGFKDGNASDGTYSGGNGNDDFKYDLNGNMIKDANKNITLIEYNHLNLPRFIEMNSAPDEIEYIYDANGNKLRKIINIDGQPTITTDYAGNYIYKNNALQFFNTAEGYFNVTSTSGNISGNYVYQYKDHLGNVRLSYTNNGTASSINLGIVEESNYYPFGLRHKGYNNVVTSTNPAQNYKYNGKELNESLGLNWYDYGARRYDPAIGRWFTVDKMADDEMQIDKTPYAYSWNSPITLNDPDGNCPWCIGALVGAATEYLVQAGTNLAKGQDLGDALWNNIDGADVLIAAGEGALTGGASAVRRVAVTATAEVIKSAVDVNLDGNTDVIGTDGSNKTVSGVVKDAAIGTVTGEALGKVDLSGKLVNASSDTAVKSAKSNVTAASKNLDKANNIRRTGNSSQAARGSKSKNSNDAFKDFNKAKQSQSTTKTLNSTVGKVNDNVVKTAVNSAQGVVTKKTIDEVRKEN